MNASDTELLRQFARDGSEEAFAELVRRHVDLVYSAALRQVGLDVQAAEDITQAVFTDLARKAVTRAHPSTLTGWLYGSTRYEAMLHRRTEARRLARETAAHAMSEILAAAPEPDWNRLQPVLDEAMCDLPDDDREAVLLRYFEKRPLAEVGARLGLSENTARMRVDRALDKLHAALKKRGITSTAVALGILLGTSAVASAPASLADRVARASSGSWQRRRPAFVGGGPRWLIPVTIALLFGISSLMWMNRQGLFGTNGDSAQIAANTTLSETDSETSTNRLTDSLITDHSITNSSSDAGASGQPSLELVLKIITKDTGQPVPNVVVRSREPRASATPGVVAVGNSEPAGDARTTLTSRAGEARIRYSPRATRLLVSTEADGFADTVLRWYPERGQVIPTNYTLRVERGVLIGGRVLDQEDKPVAGARLDIEMREKDPRSTGVESLEFEPFRTEVDEEGRWRVQRIAESMLMRIYISARGADHQATEILELPMRPDAEKSLRDQTHVFYMGRGYSVRGSIVDSAENPVAGATVWVTDSYDTRTTRSGADGQFQFAGVVRGGSAELMVMAKGYPSHRMYLGLEEDMKPLRIKLDSGKNLRIRLIDQAGYPVTDATARLSPMISILPYLPMKEEFLSAAHPDAEGRILWTNAAPMGNSVAINAKGFLEEPMIFGIAVGAERDVTLVRKPVIHGRVTDAETGEPLSEFSIVIGHEEKVPSLQQSRFRLSASEDTTFNFSNGIYRHELKKRALATAGRSHGTPWNDFMVRFEADGYQPQDSRVIRYDEGDVTLDVGLQRSPDIEVTILDPAGRPAAGAELGNVKRGRALWLIQNLRLRYMHSDPGDFVLRADSQGRLKVKRDADVERIVAVNPAGYAETSFAALDEEPAIRLQTWGRIEGRIKGVPGAWTDSASLMANSGDYAAMFIMMTASVGADGRFLLTNVPPGIRTIQQITSRAEGPAGSMATVREIEAKILPGETTQVTLGGDYRVTGRLRLPAGATVPEGAAWKGVLGMPLPTPPPGLAGDSYQLAVWNARPENQLATRQAEQVPVTVSTNGVFIADGLNPGTYRLKMKLVHAAGGKSPNAPLFTTDVEVRVPGQSGSAEIHLGDVMATPVPQ